MANEEWKKKNFVWKDSDNSALYDVLSKQINLGRKASGHYTAEAWRDIVEESKQKIDATIDKEKIINRLRTLKDQYVIMRDIKNKTDLGWSDDAKMIQVETSVWKMLVVEHPIWSPYRFRSFEEFPTLCFLFGDSTATGEYANPFNEDVHIIDSSVALGDSNIPNDPAWEEFTEQTTPTSNGGNSKKRRTREVRGGGKRSKNGNDSFTIAMDSLTKAIVGFRPPCDVSQKCIAIVKGFDLTIAELMWATDIFKDLQDCIIFEALEVSKQITWIHWKIEMKKHARST